MLEPIEVADPRPGQGQLLVDVAVSEVLFLDVQLRQGWGGEFFDLRLPFVLGMGVAGVVGEVGAGVDPTWLGRRVVAGLGGSGTYVGGGYAERAVAPATETHAVPDGVGLDRATAAISDGVMGVGRLEHAALQFGDTVVVSAAAGGIAAWLIPEARQLGVEVIALARGAKGSVARDRGADVLIDHADPGWERRLWDSLAGRTPAAVFDGNGGPVGRTLWSLAGPGTRYFSYGSGGDEFTDTADAEERGIRVWGLDEPISPDDRHRWTATALRWLAQGRVEPEIGQRLPLARAAEAHAGIETRTVAGKTLLITDRGTES